MSKEIYKNKERIYIKLEMKDKQALNLQDILQKKRNIKINPLHKKDLVKINNTPEINKKLQQFKSTKILKQVPIQQNNKIYETISSNQRNKSLNYNNKRNYQKTTYDRSCSFESEYTSKTKKNLTFDNAIVINTCENESHIKHEKINIIDKMIDGLIKLKTLVIDEESKSKVDLPKVIKQNSLLDSKHTVVNYEKIVKKPNITSVTDKAQLEISRILQTDTEKNKRKVKKINKLSDISDNTIKINQQSQTNHVNKLDQPNSFNHGNQRENPMTILSHFSKNVKLLTKDMFQNKNISLKHFKTRNSKQSFLTNSKLERENAYINNFTLKNNVLDTSQLRPKTNIVYKLIDKSLNTPYGLDFTNQDNNVSFFNKRCQSKKILNSNGCDLSFESKKIIPPTLLPLKEESVLDSNFIAYQSHLPNSDISNNNQTKKLKVEENDLINYFNNSLRENIKSDNIAKYSNGANIQNNDINNLGKYMMKINFFDESDGFMKNETFID